MRSKRLSRRLNTWFALFRRVRILAVMRSLKNNKAAGSDGIPAEFLKYSGGTRVQVLTHLFDAVLATRSVPSAWR